MLFLLLLLVEYMVVGAFDFLVFLSSFIFTLNHAPFNSIISNRIKNINSPENAIKKTYNASEIVMNNIIQTWSE